MLKRSLDKTNPYLSNPVRRREMFQMTVFTSTEIEGVKLTRSDLEKKKKYGRQSTVVRESAKSSRSPR